MNASVKSTHGPRTRRRASPSLRAPWRWALVAAMLAAALVLARPAIAALASHPWQQMLVWAILTTALVFLGVLLLQLLRAIRATRQPFALPVQDVMGWAQLSQLATRFFNAYGLLREPADDAPWTAGGDLVLQRGARRYLVHAGLWRASHIDAAAVQKLAGEIARRQAQGGMLLCARDVFTAAARQLARQRGILLLAPAQLEALPANAAPPKAAAVQPRPASPAAHAPVRQPVLRPDHEVRAPRSFMPTVPMTDTDLTLSMALDARA